VTAGRPPFVLVTGNPGKLAEARRLLGSGADLQAVEVDLPEIQSLDLEAILRAKAEEAWRRVGRPLVVEEAGLGLAALHGFPGPVAAVQPGGPADQAGLLLGDVLLALDGKPAADPGALQSILDEDRVGREIVLSVLRGGEGREVKATVGAR